MGTQTDLKTTVKEKYGEAATRAASGAVAIGCCGSPTGCGGADPITSNLYDPTEQAGLPAEAVAASLGCGNPTALAELKAGRDRARPRLGRRHRRAAVGQAGRSDRQGLRPRHDRRDAGAGPREPGARPASTNVEFLKGEIEHIPLPDNSVDVIISNCVINLSGDKARVLREAFRVLKPGGRFAVSDVVVRGEVPADIRKSMELWIGCVAGALEEAEYRQLLAGAGFGAIDVEPTRIYKADDARGVSRRGRPRSAGPGRSRSTDAS